MESAKIYPGGFPEYMESTKISPGVFPEYMESAKTSRRRLQGDPANARRKLWRWQGPLLSLFLFIYIMNKGRFISNGNEVGIGG
jgi:hypothetical protein